MRFAVARLTRRYGFMFFLMTISTGKIVVFGRICLKQGESFAMASPTVARWDLIGVSDYKRHVNRVAGLTGLKIHVRSVFFMALHAIRDLSVSCMAFVASQISVSTGLSFYFFPLLRVTSEAGTSNITFQLYSKRCMGVGMAA
jgi:hypothetical protein